MIWSRISRGSSGFTLLEVLISVALVSMIMAMIWQTTSQSISAKKRIETRQEFYHTARVALDKLNQDLSQAFLVAGPMHTGTRQGSPLLQTVFDGDSDSLTFASLSHVRLFQGSRESESAEIGYKIESDPEGDDSVLMRRESREVDNRPEDGGAWMAIANRLKSFKAEYYDGEKQDWKSSWNSESSEKGKLPRAVKVELVFVHPARPDEEIPFTTMILVGMRDAISF